MVEALFANATLRKDDVTICQRRGQHGWQDLIAQSEEASKSTVVRELSVREHRQTAYMAVTCVVASLGKALCLRRGNSDEIRSAFS